MWCVGVETSSCCLFAHHYKVEARGGVSVYFAPPPLLWLSAPAHALSLAPAAAGVQLSSSRYLSLRQSQRLSSYIHLSSLYLHWQSGGGADWFSLELQDASERIRAERDPRAPVWCEYSARSLARPLGEGWNVKGSRSGAPRIGVANFYSTPRANTHIISRRGLVQCRVPVVTFWAPRPISPQN